MPPATATPAGLGLEQILTGFGQAYDDAVRELGRVNLAVFGATGAGKSTLINGVFGTDIAKTGSGRPVTRGTHYYERSDGLLGIYDSEGTETGQTGDEILAKFKSIITASWAGPLEKQIHAIWYCVRAGDDRFVDEEAAFVTELAAFGVPVILVLTQASRPNGRLHSRVVTFARDIEARGLPLAPKNRVLPTMALPDPDLGLEVHGLAELLDATFLVAPAGVHAALTAAQQIDIDRKRELAKVAVQAGTVAALAAGVTPIPFSDLAVLIPIQLSMMAKVAATFGLPIEKKTLAGVASAALLSGGATMVGKTIVTNMLKFMPGANVAGMAIRGGVASSLTYAVGNAWIEVCAYLIKLGPIAAAALPADEIRRLFLQELKQTAKAGR